MTAVGGGANASTKSPNKLCDGKIPNYGCGVYTNKAFSYNILL
jgi:hypothetical protein